MAKMEKGRNLIKVSFDISDMKVWEPDTPFLYQLQVKLIDEKDEILDTFKRQFGMRSFRMDKESEPKGTFYLNGEKIRLCGANTMGYMQQDVIKKDWEQLKDVQVLRELAKQTMEVAKQDIQNERRELWSDFNSLKTHRVPYICAGSSRYMGRGFLRKRPVKKAD